MQRRELPPFVVQANFAMFSRPDTKADRVSYMFPTPGALRGLLQAIYHKRNKATGKMVEVTPVKVEVLNEIQMQPIPQLRRKGIVVQADKRPPQSTARTGSTYLYDVRYRLHYIVEGEQILLDELETFIRTGAFYSAPYLGTRECLARIVPDEGAKPIRQTLVEAHMWLSNARPMSGKPGDPNFAVQPVLMQSGVVTYPKFTGEILSQRRWG